MTEAIRLLRIEHYQASEMLKSIEDQIESAAGVDLALMQSIADYFADYPDQCHHPVEDVVFRRMEKRDPERAAAVAGILNDHREISEISGKLVAGVRQASKDGDQEALRSIMREFVDNHRSHIESEERDFLPLALEILSDDDWAEVGYEVFDSQDPLYKKDVEERFRRLRDDIEKRAASSIRRGAFLRDAQVLQQFEGIEDFNREMARTGKEYRLLEHPEGGYGLRKNDTTVVDIPKCSPGRAAWCAYFYVAGSTRKA